VIISLHTVYKWKYLAYYERRRGFKVRGREIAIYRQTAANFRQRRLWVHKIQFCLYISPKWRICILEENFPTKKMSDSLKFGVGGNCPIAPFLALYHDATDCMIMLVWQMCLKQRCVNVSDVDAPDCGNCSMNGVCYLHSCYSDCLLLKCDHRGVYLIHHFFQSSHSFLYCFFSSLFLASLFPLSRTLFLGVCESCSLCSFSEVWGQSSNSRGLWDILA